MREEPSLPGRAVSYWIDTTDPESHETLVGRTVDVDVAVLGGGIAGITLADELKRLGASVAVIEMRRIGSGVTGHTTAKITVQHGEMYADLEDAHGGEAATLYASAQTAALEHIAETVASRGIDCDFGRAPAYLFAENESTRESLKREAEAAQRAGVPMELLDEAPLPFPTTCGVRLSNQALFHPLRYLLALAEGIPGEGSHIFERTRALEIDEHEGRGVVTTDRGLVRADHVVLATHYPFYDKAALFTRMHAERSYALSIHLTEPPDSGMYYSSEDRGRSVRWHPTADGGLAIVAGEGHKAGQGGDERERYQALARWASERLGAERVTHHWSTQDNHSVDRLPFIGRMPGKPSVWVATGFGSWGMTNGTMAAKLLAGRIAGRTSELDELLSPSRVNPGASAKSFFRENLDVAAHFVGDKLSAHDKVPIDEIPIGVGRVIATDDGREAVYRASATEVYALSPVCTHLGCELHFNSAEKTWDCPCHGGRFTAEGMVVQGPPVRDLARKTASGDDAPTPGNSGTSS
jgi:glycine/D-amino acid oxidase-like deaminating enzyme/nitrite reductase/ring-hydroxylating ferredoxin subunit